MIRILLFVVLMLPCITRAQFPLPPGVTNFEIGQWPKIYAIAPWNLWLSITNVTMGDPSRLGQFNRMTVTLHGCEVGTSYQLLIKQKLTDSTWLTNSIFTATNIDNPHLVLLPTSWHSAYFEAYGVDRQSHWRLVEFTMGLFLARILSRKVMVT